MAVKVLPQSLAADPDRLARFQREAEVLAALNHPNIAQIYGLEDAGGVKALVMELVEGPTLADRIAQGPVPIDEALPIATQIADALEAAHERGIIHRDLKPANIKVREDGTVKVLDFGLAKLSGPAEAGHSAHPELTASPTMGAAFTGAGVILGTAAYMAPEQARGRIVDKRADIWAFGCVLFEMLSGKRAFDGRDATEMIAAVVRAEPNWEALPADTPQKLRALLKRCLEKEPKQRLHDIGDARLEIEESLARPASVEHAAAAPVLPRRARWMRAAALALSFGLGGVVVGTAVWLVIRPDEPRVTRLMITPSAASALVVNGANRDVAISPDGTRIAYVGGNGLQLFVRALDRIEPVALEGVGVPHHPFFSPDGAWIAFFDGIGALKKVSVSGGPVVTICRLGASPTGATWGPDDTIVFTTVNPSLGLLQVPAAGGEPTTLTAADAEGRQSYSSPHFLPGGQAVLFTIGPGRRAIQTGGQIAVFDFRTRSQRILVRDGYDARYAPTGHLVYAVSGTPGKRHLGLGFCALGAHPFHVRSGSGPVSSLDARWAAAAVRFGAWSRWCRRLSTN